MKAIYVWLSTLGMIFFCTACGGGTVGTGDIVGPDTRIYGTISSEEGEPLSGVEVTVADSGDSDVSDENGEFDISTKLENPNPELLIKGDSVEQVVQISGLEALDSEVKVTVSVDSKNNSVELTSIEITVRDEQSESSSSSPSVLSSSSSSAEPVEDEPQEQLSVFRGLVQFEDGTNVEGAQILLKPQSVRTSSNSRGKFRIEARVSNGLNVLQVNYKSSRGQVSLGQLPKSQALDVSMKIAIKRPPEDGGTSVGVSNAEPKVKLTEVKIKKR